MEKRRSSSVVCWGGGQTAQGSWFLRTEGVLYDADAEEPTAEHKDHRIQIPETLLSLAVREILKSRCHAAAPSSAAQAADMSSGSVYEHMYLCVHDCENDSKSHLHSEQTATVTRACVCVRLYVGSVGFCLAFSRVSTQLSSQF